MANANSKIESFETLVDQRFAFGPKGDAVLHYGAALTLEANGVPLSRIRREVIPLDSFRHHLKFGGGSKEVAFGFTEAGVISKAEYDGFPATGGRLLPIAKLCQDQFLVLGETTPTRTGYVVCSSHVDRKMAKKVQDFFVRAKLLNSSVTNSLGVTEFVAVSNDEFAMAISGDGGR